MSKHDRIEAGIWQEPSRLQQMCCERGPGQEEFCSHVSARRRVPTLQIWRPIANEQQHGISADGPGSYIIGISAEAHFPLSSNKSILIISIMEPFQAGNAQQARQSTHLADRLTPMCGCWRKICVEQDRKSMHSQVSDFVRDCQHMSLQQRWDISATRQNNLKQPVIWPSQQHQLWTCVRIPEVPGTCVLRSARGTASVGWTTLGQN